MSSFRFTVSMEANLYRNDGKDIVRFTPVVTLPQLAHGQLTLAVWDACLDEPEKIKSQKENAMICAESTLRSVSFDTIHADIAPTMKSNNWEYAYTLGYLHGKDDGFKMRKREIETKSGDDFAQGYHKGYEESRNRK